MLDRQLGQVLHLSFFRKIVLDMVANERATLKLAFGLGGEQESKGTFSSAD
jgi:hypothetical protein